MIESFNKILMIVNSEGNEKRIEKIIDFFREEFLILIKNKKLRIELTVDENSTRKLSREFSGKYENSLIIVVGGDGSNHEVVNSIDFTRTSIAIIPNGTGNDFASHIYKDYSLDQILEGFKRAKFKKVDLIKINDIYCLNVTSFGYDTTVLAKSIDLKKKYKFIRKYSFKLAIPLTITKIKPVNYNYKFKLEDGNLVEGEGSFILNAICNGSSFGGGFTPSPNARIDDGIIEMNQIDQIGLFRLLKSIPAYKSGRHLELLDISHNLRIISGCIIPKDVSIKGNIDGELYDFKKIDFEVIPKSINMMYLDL